MKRGFWADLFCTVDNQHWDLARILSAWATLSVSLLAAYKLYQNQELNIAEYATAMMTVLGGSAVFIGAKDIARAKSKGAEQP